MNKILIIGGSGFVGSRLISQIGEENCYNFDKNPSPFYQHITTIGDIRNIEQIKFKNDFKTVVLLAAEHRDDVSPKSLYYDVNVEGTKNVLSKMDQAGIKNLIFTSSVAVYGLNKNNPDENFPKDPFNHYGKSKLQAEIIIEDWYKNDSSGKSVTIIRPTVIFGERNRGNVFNLLKQISTGKFLMVGKGLNKKSMAYLGNVVSFIDYRARNIVNGYNIFNYSDSPDLNMNELVSLVENKMNLKTPKIKLPFFIGMLAGYVFDVFALIFRKKFSISSVRVKKFCATTQFNSSKVMKVFNPPYTLNEGLNKTLNYEFLSNDKDDILFYSE